MTIDELKKLAKKKTTQEQAIEDGDEFVDMSSCSGGNFDDAHSIGYEDGQIELARDVLELLEGKN